jgi:glycerophosphoryl diester phosphodiesterase
VLQIPVRHRLAGRPVTLVTEDLLETVHRAGKQVHVWTVDDRSEMERLVDLGVDGIFTDRIDTLRGVLTARGLWA